MSDEKYLIRCAGREGGMDSCLWWRPERCGYTTKLDEAGRYTREEAERQQRSRPDVDVAVPESVALRLAWQVVSRDSLPWSPPIRKIRKIPMRCAGCGRMRKHDSNPYVNCDDCEEWARNKARDEDRRRAWAHSFVL